LTNSFTVCGHHVITIIHPSLKESLNRDTTPGSTNTASYELIRDLAENKLVLFGTQFEDALKDCVAGLVIAPEERGILQELSATLEGYGKRNLGCPSRQILNSANKYLSFSLLKKAGVKTPLTKLLKGNKNSLDDLSGFNYPFIIKPVDGCDSRQVYLVENNDDLEIALQAFHKMQPILIQEHIQGEHLSVTLLGRGENVYPLSLNLQEFRCRKPFHYSGGTTGIKHPMREKIFTQAIKAWRATGTSGLGGVDLVVSHSGIYVVEINPRPTAPVIAIASCPSYNLGEMIIHTAFREGVKIPLFNETVRFDVNHLSSP
jgi:predicted ATP-grasp superfamily ATP-dependent carboligase